MNTYLPVGDPVTGLVKDQYLTPVRGDQFTAKGDHRISSHDQASIRFFRMNQTSPTYAGNKVSYVNNSNLNQGITVRDTHTFRSNLIGDFGVSYTNLTTSAERVGPNKTPLELGGIYASDGVRISLQLTITGQTTSYSSRPWYENSSLMQFDGKLTLGSGKHLCKFGILGLHQTERLKAQLSTAGADTFSGVFTGNSIADYLIGRPVSFTQSSIFDP